MTSSYIQTSTAAAPVQQERLHLHSTLNWVLPLSYREEQVADIECHQESNNNGTSSSSAADDCKATIGKKPKWGAKNVNSLNMCTETLGCENGTMYSAEDYKRDSLLCERVLGFLTSSQEEEAEAMVERRIIKRVRTGTTDRLPPPPPALTTRRNRENFLNIVRERANGRMVMYAVRHRSTVTAERSGGRLTLRLLSNRSDHDETEEVQDDEDERQGEDYLGVVGKEMNSGGGEEAPAEGKKYVFVGRCYKEDQEKRNGWTPLMVASAI